MIENDDEMLIDSNILIYAFDNSNEEKREIAQKIIDKLIKNEINVVLSTQNTSEFYYNVTRKIGKPLTEKMAKENISQLISLSNVRVLKIFEKSILNAMDISSEYNISYWDALIASVMKENNVYTIVTENDKDFKKIPWLKVINPFDKL